MFHIYVLFLILGGIAMLVMAGIKSGQSKARRVWNGVFGAGFLGYGLYLLLFFQSGHYVLFYYVFILPIIMIVRFFRDRGRQGAAAFQGPPSDAGQPPAYGQPPRTASPRSTVSRRGRRVASKETPCQLALARPSRLVRAIAAGAGPGNRGSDRRSVVWP